MTLTIGAFLEPRSADAEELRHVLADSARSIPDTRRYEILGKTEPWHSFNVYDSTSESVISQSLEIEFTPNWQAWIPDAARVIYSERMLENLYSSTLLTRVNIALQQAIPSEDRRITIITCPGAFDSHDPLMRGDKATVILPDWIVLEGTYTPHDGSFPGLENLAALGKIVAVGDTKLVTQRSDTSGTIEKIIADTHSCHQSYLAQVQHYGKMLRTRFGFVLTNKELVLAQLLQEDEAPPRPYHERGLRSITGIPLYPGLLPDFHTSSTGDANEPAVNQERPFHASLPKRPRDSSNNSTPSRRFPASVDRSEDQIMDGLPSSPLASCPLPENMPSSPPRSYQPLEQPPSEGLPLTPHRDASHSPSKPVTTPDTSESWRARHANYSHLISAFPSRAVRHTNHQNATSILGALWSKAS